MNQKKKLCFDLTIFFPLDKLAIVANKWLIVDFIETAL